MSNRKKKNARSRFHSPLGAFIGGVAFGLIRGIFFKNKY